MIPIRLNSARSWAGVATSSIACAHIKCVTACARGTRRAFVRRLQVVSEEEIDEYLRAVDEPNRSTLRALRRTILEVIPEAEQGISYRVPAFRVRGKVVAGFASFAHHLSYLPFSGSVLGQLGDELQGYTMTKSSLHFSVDRPLPKTLVKKLIAMRLEEIDRG
jgi:uncharacterized protein YdhG (YjbR/CyaY superfamily)